MSYHNARFVGTQVQSVIDGALDLGEFVDEGAAPLFVVSSPQRIDVYDEEGFFEASANLQTPFETSDADHQAYRNFFSGADVIEAGTGGLVRLAPEACSLAGISELVVILGTGNMVSIWEPQRLSAAVKGPVLAHSVEARWLGAVQELRAEGRYPEGS